MTPDDSLPPADPVGEPAPPADEAEPTGPDDAAEPTEPGVPDDGVPDDGVPDDGEGQAAPDEQDEGAGETVDTGEAVERPARRARRRGVHDRIPDTWRASVAVPRWEVATAIGLITVLLAVAIAASALALTRSDPEPEATGSPEAVSINDDFTRGSEQSLGVAPTGQEWVELQGEWGVGYGSAQILRPDGNLPSITTVDLGDTDGLVRMRIGTVTPGMGVAVRVRDAGTYLAIEAEPSFGTYAIRRSVNGQIAELGAVGLANAADNALVEVRMRGDSVDIYVDGTYVKTITDRADPDATGVGLIGQAGTAEARWVHFDAQNAAALTQGLPAQPDTTTAED